jgi:methylmalonyl-CoA/ethylmalonyl-CoA epimerase
MKLHHVGIAVAAIDEGARQARKFYAEQIINEIGPVHDPLQDADLQLFEFRDGSRLELVAGQPAQSALRRGSTLHHVCYEVHSLEAAVAEWHGRGAVLVSPPKPAVLFGFRMVAFVLTPMGLTEFLSHE